MGKEKKEVIRTEKVLIEYKPKTKLFYITYGKVYVSKNEKRVLEVIRDIVDIIKKRDV